jgi:hypothetical protein
MAKAAAVTHLPDTPLTHPAEAALRNFFCNQFWLDLGWDVSLYEIQPAFKRWVLDLKLRHPIPGESFESDNISPDSCDNCVTPCKAPP